MSISNSQKQKIIEEYRVHDKDTGSSNIQIACLTTRINNLVEHFKKNYKDHHSRVGLLKLINKRKSLIKYLKRVSFDSYKSLIEKLKLRK